ncbi:MAG: universal stress protein [Actinomycetota bacterium]|nr:universal stress protein [Actinomycetota bacterium]
MNAMSQGRPAVVGIDGSEPARRAAVWAAEQAARRKVPLRLVNAVNLTVFAAPGAGYVPADYFTAIERAGNDELESAGELVRQRYPEQQIQLDLRTEHPVSVLVDESSRAGLLVLGAHGPDSARPFLAGSTAVAVAAHATCPVAVIPAEDTDVSSSDGPVVVGIDGTPASEPAVRFAFEEASLRRAELVAVHAWSEFTGGSEYRVAREPAADWSSLAAEHGKILAERLAGWSEKYPDVTVRRVFRRKHAAEALLSHADGAQLLVVGSRGHGGFAGMLLGSVSRKLIHHPICPLVVVRSSDD